MLQSVRVGTTLRIRVDVARDRILKNFDGAIEGGKVHCLLVVIVVVLAVVVVLVIVAGTGVVDLDAVQIIESLVEAVEGIGGLDVIVTVAEGASVCIRNEAIALTSGAGAGVIGKVIFLTWPGPSLPSSS